MTNKISFAHYFLLIIFIFFILLILIKNNNYFNDLKIESYQNNDDDTRKCPDTCRERKSYSKSGAISILNSNIKNNEDNSKTKNPKIKKFTYNNVNYWGVSETGCFNKSCFFCWNGMI